MKKVSDPTVEFIENKQIIVVTQQGEVDYKKAKRAIEGVIRLLDKTTHITHLISDMRHAKLLPEAAPLTSGKLIERLESHPNFGISIIVMKMQKKDAPLENVMDEYNKRMWKDRILSPSGEYKRSVIYFTSLEEAKTFLLTFNEMWKVVR